MFINNLTINMDIINNFKIEQYKYLINKNFIYNLINYNKYKPLIVATENDVNLLEVKNKTKITSIEEFVLLIKQNKSAVKVTNEDINKNFFISYLITHKKEAKKLINNNIYILNNFNINKYYLDLFEHNKFKNINEFIKFFNDCFNITFWKLLTVDLEDLNENYIKKYWNYEEGFIFWIDFFKKRKNQIKNERLSQLASNFILKIYKKDLKKIKSFIPYVDILKSQIFKVKNNFIENEYKYSEIINVDLKAMFNSVGISNYSINKYRETINILIKSLLTNKYIEDYEIFTLKNKKNRIYILFYRNNQKIYRKKIYIEIILSFFIFLKKEEKYSLEEISITKWLNFYFLEKEIKNKNLALFHKINKV